MNQSMKLLRSVLWQQIDGSEINLSGKEWKGIAEFFSKQSLDGLLPDAIALLPAYNQPPVSVKMPLIARQLQVEQMNRAMNSELLAFTDELNKRDIPYVLLKGQGVATLYPNPQHRVCGDIDLYVPTAHLKEVHRGLMAFGAVREMESRHHINYRVNGIEWELHHSIYYFQKEDRNHTFMRYVEEAMQDAPAYVTIGDEKVRVLPPTMNVLLLLSHIVDHFYSEGVGLRQLCDYALMLHHKRGEIDEVKLLQALDELSLTRAYQVFGYICTHYLGLPEEDLALRPTDRDIHLAHRVMADCLKGGNFGHAESNRRQTLWQKVTFYTRFLRRLWRYRQLHPSEALWWPLAKMKRALKGEVSISEERSAVNRSEAALPHT